MARKSATAIDNPSAIRLEMPKPMVVSTPAELPKADKAILKVVIIPSRPPYTADLMN